MENKRRKIKIKSKSRLDGSEKAKKIPPRLGRDKVICERRGTRIDTFDFGRHEFVAAHNVGDNLLLRRPSVGRSVGWLVQDVAGQPIYSRAAVYRLPDSITFAMGEDYATGHLRRGSES